MAKRFIQVNRGGEAIYRKEVNTISIDEFKDLQKGSKRKKHNEDREYQICKAISNYLKLKYPHVIFHFDYAGLQLTKTQAGKMKAIQGGKGWPDLFIAEQRHFVNAHYYGLFIELKAEGTNLYKKGGMEYATPHIADQAAMIEDLLSKGYKAMFCIGTDEAMEAVDEYMKL